MKAFVLGAVLACGMVSGANAQANSSDRPMTQFTRSALLSALSGIDAETEEQSGKPNISVTFDNGLMGDALLMACEDQQTSRNCLGTSILVTYETPDDATPAKVREAINEYNYRQNFGRAYLDPDGQISLRMYIIADGGITMANYKRQLALFSLSAAKLPDYVYGE